MDTAADDIRAEGIVAVIVGIDGYRAVPPLNCATNDAVSLAEVLKKVWAGRHFHVDTLVWPSLEGKPGDAGKSRRTWGIPLPADARSVTREGILEAVRQAAARVKPSDTFLFYFAGHGRLVRDRPCLVTIRDGHTSEGIDYLEIGRIQQAAAECPSDKRMMILDCCQTSRQTSAKFFDRLRALTKGWALLISCSPGERSLEDVVKDDGRGDYLEQGLFTASLVRGLRGDASLRKGESLSLMELAVFACNRVQVESEERLAGALCARDTGQPALSPEVSMVQHPVLLSEAASLGGPLGMVMAPARAVSKQDLRRSLPSGRFPGWWLHFMFGPWPVKFPLKHMFREGAALLYCGAVLLTMLWFGRTLGGIEPLVLAIAAGVGSAVLWWLMAAFAVAANEDGWHSGGYVTAISQFLWHCLMLLGFFAVARGGSGNPAVLTWLAVNLMLILAAVIIFGCNASQSIIALAETIREDERREIREAITIFRQFRSRLFGADFFNLIAMTSARPVVYFIVLILAAAVLCAHTAYTLLSHAGQPDIWVILLRNACGLVFTAWLAVWYDTAFRFLRKEVYKR